MPQKLKPTGFALVEFLLVIVIIGLLAGVAAYVYTQKNKSDKVLNTATSTSEKSATQARPGTTASIDQLTESEGASEQSAAGANDKATGQAATSDSSSLSSLGGAYNETSL